MLRRRLHVAFAFAVLASAALVSVASAAAATYGTGKDYAPENIADLASSLDGKCMLGILCPVSSSLHRAVHLASAGDATGEWILAQDLLHGWDGAPHDEAVGGAWLGKSAEQGNAPAATELVRRQRYGLDVDADWDKIAAALNARAKQGGPFAPSAMRALGPMYILGRGVGRDAAEGVRLLQAAADAGDDGAMEDLMDIYAQGRPGIPIDRKEQLRWVVRLAEKGHPDMMTLAGRLMLNPSIVAMFNGLSPTAVAQPDRNVAEGYRWLMRGALTGYPGSQSELAQLFENGMSVDGAEIVSPDLVSADVWYRLSAKDPIFASPRNRASLEFKMTSAEITEAKKRADAFKPISFAEAMARPIELPPAGGQHQ